MAFLGRFCGKADQPQVVPAALRPYGPGPHHHRLNPLDRDRHVGQGQQAATAAQALGSPFEPKAPVGQNRADNPAGQTQHDQRRQCRQRAEQLGRAIEPSHSKTAIFGRTKPSFGVVPIERQQEVELLGQSQQHHEEHQTERIEAKGQQARQVHCEQQFGRRLGRTIGRRIGLHCRAGLALAHRRAQPRRVVLGYIAQLRLFAFAAAGLEPDHRQPQHPGQRRLLNRNVGDPVIRNRAGRTAQQPLLDPDVIRADEVAKPPPAQPAKQQAAQQDHADHRQRAQSASPRAIKRGNRRYEQIGQAADRSDNQP